MGDTPTPPAPRASDSEPDGRPDDVYQYEPFPDNYSIRILTLEPGTGPSPLTGSLSIANLNTQPTYDALSYVWGTDTRTSSILLSGKPLPLTHSLAAALHRMRDPVEPRRLWADQVCINQADVAERSQQVGLMNVVYRGAARIRVWLGEDEEGVAGEAVRVIEHLREVFADEVKKGEFRRAHSEELLEQSEEPWVPLAKMTKLPWFNRIWIVQEIGTTAPATLYWGSISVDWANLYSVVNVLNADFHLLRTRFALHTSNIRYLYQRFVEPASPTERNRRSFIYELHRARHLQSKDPRDRVYAFLGHFSLQLGSEALQGLEADYARPVEEVYTDVAARALRDAPDLQLLAACQALPHAYRRRTGPALDLPSWVPDWRVLPLHLIGAPESPHRASGDTRPDSLRIDTELRRLYLRGMRVDVVERQSWAFYGNAFQHFRQYTKASRKPPIEALWSILYGPRERFDLQKKYREGEDSAFFALVQTLTNACVGTDRTRPYESVSKAEWLSHGAAYLVRATRPDVVSQELQEVARGGDAFKWSHEATLVTRHRKFCVTRGGYFVLGPDAVREGDEIVVWYGGRTPFAVRQKEDGWELLGECYVHGLMDGEVLSMGLAEEDFAII